MPSTFALNYNEKDTIGNFQWARFPLHPKAYGLYADVQIFRFLSKIKFGDDDSCWLWQGALSDKGYGCLTLGNKRGYSHRFSWELKNGIYFAKGLEGCHACDVRGCVNPYHIFPGTRRENMLDMSAKGRNHAQKHPEKYRGDNNHSSVLKGSEIPIILELLAKGESQKNIASMFNVSKTAINAIARRRSWSHLIPNDFQELDKSKGENHHASKLKNADILAIKELLAKGVSHRQIASQFGIAKSTITAINTGKAWSHIL